jgi:hypothetical protein
VKHAFNKEIERDCTFKPIQSEAITL